MTRDDFDEWVDFTCRVYQSNEWACSMSLYWEALKVYTIEEMKAATSKLYATRDKTYLMNHRRHGYSLIALIPTIAKFEECIIESSKNFREIMALQRKNRIKEW